MVRAAAIVLALLAAPAAHAARCPPPGGTISAAHFVKLARGAEPVRLQGVDVHGKVKLGQTNVPISCRGCAFDELDLRDAVIDRVLDLRGLRGLASLDAAGAEFKQPVLVGSRDGCAGIGRASFFFATFDDSADFEGSSFGLANLGQARFRGPAGFGHVSFARPVSFAGASFEDDARFDDAVFERPVSFARASFSGRAHFLRAIYGRQPCVGKRPAPSADFTSATFGGTADLSQGWFCGEASFQRTRFDGGASFVGAQFRVLVAPPKRGSNPFATAAAEPPCDSDRPPDTALVFDHASSAGRLDFGSVLFNGTPVFLAVAARTLSLEDASFDRCVPLQLSGLESIDDLRLSPAAATRVEGTDTPIQVLRAVGASAAARDDLAVANDAHYRLLELTSEREGPVRRFLD